MGRAQGPLSPAVLQQVKDDDSFTYNVVSISVFIASCSDFSHVELEMLASLMIQPLVQYMYVV